MKKVAIPLLAAVIVPAPVNSRCSFRRAWCLSR